MWILMALLFVIAACVEWLMLIAQKRFEDELAGKVKKERKGING